MADQPRLTRIERRVNASIASANNAADRCALFLWTKQHHRSMRSRHRGGRMPRHERD